MEVPVVYNSNLIITLIILITNKMKLITHFSLVNRLFINNHRYSFSNFIKDNPLSIDDLIIKTTDKTNSLTSSQRFNKLKPAKITKQTINPNPNQLKIKQINNIIDQSLSHAIVDAKSSLYFQPNLSAETKMENALQFMKYLDHTLQKSVALEIINLIEKFCSRNNYLEKENSSKNVLFSNNNIRMILNDNQAKLFESIKEHLILNLNFYSQNIQTNNQLIQCLLEMLAISDPNKINAQTFQRESFCLDEEERIQKQTGKQFYLENTIKYSQLNQNQQAQTNQPEENKYKLALQQAFLLKDRTKISKLHLKKSNTQAGAQRKIQQQSVKVASQKVMYQKKNIQYLGLTSKAKEDDLKSAYVYQLPYNITEQQAQDFIKYLQISKDIKVQSYVLFPYKNFLQKNHYDVIFRIPQQYQEQNVHIQKTLKPFQIDQFTKPSTKSSNKKSVSKKAKKDQFSDVPLQNQTKGKKIVTDALLMKIKKQSYSKFNKSSMILKFSSKENKEKILTKESRLYGLCYKNLKNIKFQEGFSKSTISLSGIPWGCSSKEFQQFINSIIESQNISVSTQEDCILTKNMVSIQFDHLSQALVALQKLNNTTFQNKTIKAHLKYGPCKLYNNQYSLSTEDQYDRLKKKIDVLGTYFKKKYDDSQECSQQ